MFEKALNKKGSNKYHYQIGLPRHYRVNYGEVRLKYSTHAITRAMEKAFNLPTAIDTSKAKVIEMEDEAGKLVKVLYRVPYNETHDMLLAVMPNEGFFVKTAWLNSKKDTHKTLDRSQYCKP